MHIFPLTYRIPPTREVEKITALISTRINGGAGNFAIWFATFIERDRSTGETGATISYYAPTDKSTALTEVTPGCQYHCYSYYSWNPTA